MTRRPPRYFVILGRPTPEEALDAAGHEGPAARAVLSPSPGPEAVYACVEVPPPEDASCIPGGPG